MTLAIRASGQNYTLSGTEPASYWLHAVALHRVVKRDGAKHIAMVCHGTGLHAEFLGTAGKRLNLDGAV